MVVIPKTDQFGRSKSYYDKVKRDTARRTGQRLSRGSGGSSSQRIIEDKARLQIEQEAKQKAEQERRSKASATSAKQKAIADALFKQKLFAESERKIAQHAVKIGRLSVRQANERLRRSAKVIQKRVDTELLKRLRNGQVAPTEKKITSGIRIGRSLTETEKVNLLRNTKLTISELDKSKIIRRNGVQYVETPQFNFRLETPQIERGKRVVKGKLEGDLTIFERMFIENPFDVGSKKLIEASKRGSEGMQKELNKMLVRANNIKTGDNKKKKIAKEILIAGLNINKKLVSGATPIVKLSVGASNLLFIKNPAWHKPTRDDISSAIVTYTPIVYNWSKENIPKGLRIIKETITDKKKRDIAIIAGTALAVEGLTAVKLSPGKWLGRAGGEFLLFEAVGGTVSGLKILKGVSVVSKKALKSSYSIGRKFIKGNIILNAIIKKGGKSVKRIKFGSKLIVKKVKKKGKKLREKLRERLRKKLGLKRTIRKRKFTKKERQALRRAIAQEKRLIKGVKVSKKEFKSFQTAEREWEKLKRIGKFVNKVQSRGGKGITQSIKKSAITEAELNILNIYKNIPKSLLNKAEKISFTSISQKLVSDVPILKRFGGLKKGFWRINFKEKIFYQNTMSFSLFNKVGKSLGTISFDVISSKPISRFRTLSNALRLGTRKTITISKLTGNKYVQSIVINKKKILGEFISRVKLKRKGIFTDILIDTRKPFGIISKKIKKRFKRSIKVSRTAARTMKTTQRRKSLVEKGILRIKQSQKVIEKIRSASIISPVVINTTRIDNIIRILNKVKVSGFSNVKKLRLIKLKKVLRVVRNKNKVKVGIVQKTIISKSKLKQIKRLSKEFTKTTTIKESLSAASIPVRIRSTKTIKGISRLKKLRAVRRLKKLKTLSKLEKSTIKSIIALSKTATSLRKMLKSATTQTQKNKIITKLKSATSSMTKQLKNTSIKTVKVFMPSFSPVITPIIQIRPKKIKRILRFRLKIKKLEYRTLANPVSVYKVFGKIKGKKRLLMKDLTKGDAKNFLAYEVDNKLMRTISFKATGKRKRVIRLPSKYSGQFSKVKHKLRPFKIKKGKKLRISGYIERKKYIGDTKGEQRQLITSKLRKKRLRKRLLLNKKKTTTKKKVVKRKIKRRNKKK